MTADSRRTTQRSLQALLSSGALGARTDVQLLDLFRTRRDETSDEAFRVLVERHGAMVHTVCRRVLGDSCDSDDAFQATFLVLVQKAGSIRKGDSLGSWLHGVALRVARRARDQGRRRRSFFRSTDHEALARHPGRDDGSADASASIHDEIERLPSRLREPLILCCLEGRSYDEAAETLGLNEPSLRGRLYRGRKKLEARLKGLGVWESGSLPCSWIAANPTPKLVEAVVRLATQAECPTVLAAASSSPSIVTLAQGATFAMTLSTIKTTAAVGALAGLCVFGTVVVAQQGQDSQSKRIPTETREVADKLEPARVEPSSTPKRVEVDESNEKILNALDRRFLSKFPEPLTLEVFLTEIKKASMSPGYSGIPIHVDPVGLSEAEVTLTSELPGGWIGHTMSSLLEENLRSIRLGFVVRDGFLMINSRQNVIDQKLNLLDKKLDRILQVVEPPRGRQ